ncbi:CMGC/MAPK protein kinase, variant [Aphanomyces invadans]|uniref:CMGC/MAPK protein kinase, variant n=1 Tax=Aphanomyces invadans TaxID=157072 RepID=A0A024TG18_9STRA|nr:CMGC/MAPK protein kinase, variant [Aphanomyces invadans]ETV93115.1 CMGC/MAPK protein kinase, variant [Aphanomyces invadans]|eukprot:XP_008878379.1 CMGC/MAPK protein kinase, variant [Aphanomyces invadans]
MLKQGSRFRMLTKRYFILRLEEKHMTLGYYTSKEDLVLCSETPIGPGHALYDISVEGHRRLELRHGTSSLIVEIESEQDFVKWKNALQEAVRWHHAMVFDGANKVTSYGKKCLDDEAAEALARQEAAKKQRETVAKKAEATATANANKPKFLPSMRPGFQCFTVSNTKFDIPVDYTYVKTIGSGAYGVVIAAEKSGKQVAIKNIQRAFDDLTDAKRIVREIKLMRHFRHKCLLGIEDIIEPVEIATFEDVYIVSECMATDLHRVIYSRHPLSEEHVCFFLYQMLMVRGIVVRRPDTIKCVGTQVHPQRKRDSSRPQAVQHPSQCQLRAESVRFWIGPRRRRQFGIDRIRCDEMVPRARNHVGVHEIYQDRRRVELGVHLCRNAQPQAALSWPGLH